MSVCVRLCGREVFSLLGTLPAVLEPGEESEGDAVLGFLVFNRPLGVAASAF